MTGKLYGISVASFLTGIPTQSIRNLERRGVVGPFLRDSYDRRLLTDRDIDALKAYAATREERRAA